MSGGYTAKTWSRLAAAAPMSTSIALTNWCARPSCQGSSHLSRRWVECEWADGRCGLPFTPGTLL